MSGCLFTLALGAVVIFLALTLGLPALAEGLVGGALSAAGLQADDTRVDVTTEPTTELLTLHADRVRVTATKATFRGMEIDRFDLTLGDVALLDRTAGTVDGELSGVTVTDLPGGPVTLRQLTISGGGDAINAATTVPNADVEALIADGVERSTGARPSAIGLAAPDLVTVKVAGTTTHAQLVVTDTGNLALLAKDGPAAGSQETLLRGGQDLPVKLTQVKVTSSGDLKVSGRLSVGLF